MFNLKEFTTKNIVNGIKNGTFSKEYGNIMAVDYLVKGILTEDDVANIDAQITAWEAERAEQEVTESTDEVIKETVEDTGEATEPPMEEIEPETEQSEPETTETELENTGTEMEIEENEPVE